MLGKPRTAAQDAAVTRNWGIRNLRALYALARQLSPARREQVHALIDEELTARGAETHAVREARLRADRVAAALAAEDLADLEMELPF